MECYNTHNITRYLNRQNAWYYRYCYSSFPTIFLEFKENRILKEELSYNEISSSINFMLQTLNIRFVAETIRVSMWVSYYTKLVQQLLGQLASNSILCLIEPPVNWVLRLTETKVTLLRGSPVLNFLFNTCNTNCKIISELFPYEPHQIHSIAKII